MIKTILGILLVALGVILAVTFLELWSITDSGFHKRPTFLQSFIGNGIWLGKILLVVCIIATGIHLINKSSK